MERPGDFAPSWQQEVRPHRGSLETAFPAAFDERSPNSRAWVGEIYSASANPPLPQRCPSE